MRAYVVHKVFLGFAALIGLVFVASCATPSAHDVVLLPDQDAVVVLHGLGRSPAAMSRLAGRLEDAGYQSVTVGYDSLNDTPEQILRDVSQQINACCVSKSPQVHFVGHSLGGLVVRAYLMENRVPNLGRVVLLGTPNAGTTLVDNLRGDWWFDMLGPTAAVLGTDENSFPNGLEPPAYPVGVIAGRKDSDNEDLLPGEDDGLVAVDSTKLEGMADFLIVETGHSAMRYDEDVAKYTISFLQTGSFTARRR